jgi:hypothetical protein
VTSAVVDAVGTFALSLILAYGFLRLRCRKIGPPFGPRSRYWALFIVVGTAAVAAGAGLLIVAASHHDHASYVGVVVPGGLWFRRLPPQRDRDLLPSTLSSLLTLPFSRLYDRMGDDMQDWCDVRLRAAAGLRGGQALAVLDSWRNSITHKINIERMINLETSPARLRAALQMHPSTQHIRGYADGDLERLASRLEVEALNELHLFLAYIYRLGYQDMLIYPFRPSTQRVRVQRAEPTAPEL